ncbi:hypothetical protein EDB92DRAFT_534056 [Lactarius akahatsu]|uniref:Uncharacterized protein n=1 Tax=Lactarius akahatsu TaxID=416441 RepID=A0AAD4LHQ0_9AGAM|nr:hypothetical protein EDB92DRAFT_534056 [Lactarius akahatsu]
MTCHSGTPSLVSISSLNAPRVIGGPSGMVVLNDISITKICPPTPPQPTYPLPETLHPYPASYITPRTRTQPSTQRILLEHAARNFHIFVAGFFNLTNKTELSPTVPVGGYSGGVAVTSTEWDERSEETKSTDSTQPAERPQWCIAYTWSHRSHDGRTRDSKRRMRGDSRRSRGRPSYGPGCRASRRTWGESTMQLCRRGPKGAKT